MTEVLDTRALNRALLARQHLLERVALPAEAMVEHLVGLQAQEPFDPYYALWSRIDGFQPTELGALLERRQAVRIALMRSTIHLVSARDCWPLRRWGDAVHERLLKGQFRRQLDGLDRDALLTAGRELLQQGPMLVGELGKRLAERFPGRDPGVLGLAVRVGVPLVQVPPRAVWGKSGRALHTPAELWLDGPPAPAASEEEVVLRYLAAFGPASAMDMQQWCGLTRQTAIFERLRPRLRTFRDARGVELFDLPDAPRPDAGAPAPPRFLPVYDNVLLSHKDRTRIVPEDAATRFDIAMRGELRAGTVLVDGFVRGVWKLARARDTVRLNIAPVTPLSAAERAPVEEEGARLLEFAAPAAATRTVAFGDTV